MAGKKRGSMLMALVMLAGICLLAYPSIAQWLARRHAEHLVGMYQQQAADQAADASQGGNNPMEEAAAFNAMLARRTELEVLSPADMQQYLRLLNPFGDGVMGTLTIPKFDVSLPIGHTAADEVLQKCIGHMPETSLPIGGSSTHAVLAGHSGLASTRLLTDLPKMEMGDTFSVSVLDQTLTYQVDQVSVVLPDNLDALAIIPGEDHVTLLTCVPYGINSHRLLVRGVRVE